MAVTIVGPNYPRGYWYTSGSTSTTMAVPASLTADDTSYFTTRPNTGTPTVTRLRDFGFALPLTAIITKMTLEGAWYSGSNPIYGTQTCSLQAYVSNATCCTPVTVTNYTTMTAFSGDVVGTYPTPAQINNANFEVWLTCSSNYSGGVSVPHYTDYVRVTVEYYAAPTVTTTPVTGVTDTQATSGGTISDDGGAAVIERGVCWNTTGSPTILDSRTQDGSGTGTFTSTATIQASHGYHLRAYARNVYATGYGAEIDFQTAGYFCGSLGRTTSWARALTADEVLTDLTATTQATNRSLAKGTVVLAGITQNRRGAPIPAEHVRAGWWVQNIARGSRKPLFITGHSVSLEDGRNALTIGVDWMEKELGVKYAELLALPASKIVEPEPIEMPASDDVGDGASGSSGDDKGVTYTRYYYAMSGHTMPSTAPKDGYHWEAVGGLIIKGSDGSVNDCGWQGWTQVPDTIKVSGGGTMSGDFTTTQNTGTGYYDWSTNTYYPNGKPK